MYQIVVDTLERGVQVATNDKKTAKKQQPRKPATQTPFRYNSFDMWAFFCKNLI